MLELFGQFPQRGLGATPVVERSLQVGRDAARIDECALIAANDGEAPVPRAIA
jgi:hypothetical protein